MPTPERDSSKTPPWRPAIAREELRRAIQGHHEAIETVVGACERVFDAMLDGCDVDDKDTRDTLKEKMREILRADVLSLRLPSGDHRCVKACTEKKAKKTKSKTKRDAQIVCHVEMGFSLALAAARHVLMSSNVAIEACRYIFKKTGEKQRVIAAHSDRGLAFEEDELVPSGSDALQTCAMAVGEALIRYDPFEGTKLATLAKSYIPMHLQKARRLDANIQIPETTINVLLPTIESFAQKFGRWPSVDELVQEIRRGRKKFTRETIEAALARMRTSSLDGGVMDEDEPQEPHVPDERFLQEANRADARMDFAANLLKLPAERRAVWSGFRAQLNRDLSIGELEKAMVDQAGPEGGALVREIQAHAKGTCDDEQSCLSGGIDIMFSRKISDAEQR